MMPTDTVELDKRWVGHIGAMSQGVLFAVIALITILIWYLFDGWEKRNIAYAGMLFSFFQGMFLVSPFTETIRGYPFLWALEYYLSAFLVLALGYRLLYRFHFKASAP